MLCYRRHRPFIPLLHAQFTLNWTISIYSHLFELHIYKLKILLISHRVYLGTVPTKVAHFFSYTFLLQNPIFLNHMIKHHLYIATRFPFAYIVISISSSWKSVIFITSFLAFRVKGKKNVFIFLFSFLFIVLIQNIRLRNYYYYAWLR